MKRLPLCFALPALCLQAWSAPYPALDTTSRWSIGDWGHTPGKGFYFASVSKSIWNAPGQGANKTVFYNFSVQGLRIGGLSLPLARLNYLGEMSSAGYIVKFGSFDLDQGITLTASVYFYDDGRMETISDVSGPSWWNGTDYEIVMRFDYDLAGSDNNVAEFLWNPNSEGKSLSPPQSPLGLEGLDGRLEYTPAQGGNVDYWSAVAHEMAVAYPPLPAGTGVERPAYARIMNAGQKFGMVLWSDPYTPVEAVFKTYGGNNGNLNPRANILFETQRVAEWPGYPRYAYAGSDQLMHIRLKGVFQNGMPTRFTGKLFQRPNNRPLAVNVRQHPAADLGGWTFNPDFPIRNVEGDIRTFRTALGDLPGPENLKVGEGLPYLPYDGFAPPGGRITDAQLHNLLTSTRNTSESSLNGVTDWKLDLYLVNWTLDSDPNLASVMFDQGPFNSNHIAREGAVIFWPNHGGNEDAHRKAAALSILQAAGMSLNFNPSWTNCPYSGFCWNDPNYCGGYRCGTECPPGAPNCRFHHNTCWAECVDGGVMSYTDVLHNNIRFGTTPAKGSLFSERDWYRMAPEAWVKPGRFGINPTSSEILPNFLTK